MRIRYWISDVCSSDLPVVKFVFNAGQFALQVAAATVAYHAVLGGHSAIEPIGWLAALVAVTVAFAVSAVTVTTVMVLAGAQPTIRSQAVVVGVGWAAALAGGTVALGAAAVLWSDGRSWVLPVIIGAAPGEIGRASGGERGVQEV